MPRRRESPKLAAAREQLRARYDEQQAAAAAFFDGADRLGELREELEGVEAELRRHAAALVEALGVDTAAQLTGWSRGRLAEAQRAARPPRSSGADHDAVVAAAVS